MSKIFYILIPLGIVFGGIAAIAGDIQPKNVDALYAGESIVLQNEEIKIVFFKREVGVHPAQKDGFSWAEIYGPDDSGTLNRYLGVIEHFGEVDIEGQNHPLRMDALDHKIEKMREGTRITFTTEIQIPEEGVMTWGNVISVRGEAMFFVPKEGNWVEYDLHMEPEFRVNFRSVRGPWVRVGAYDFGAEKRDAIFSGLEWLQGKEWSSSVDYLAPEEALRVTPHPRKVTAPVMAVGLDGLALSLSWDPHLNSLSVLSRDRHPQPVFACPNFIDKRDDNLMGLMFPSSGYGMEENDLRIYKPLMFPEQGIRFHSRITVSPGTSLDAISNWVKTNGFPDPGEERFSREDLLDRVAAAYNAQFWEKGVGWTYHKEYPDEFFHGVAWYLALTVGEVIKKKPSYYVPEVVDYYIKHGKDPSLVAGLKEKAEWCLSQGYYSKRKPSGKSRLKAYPELFDWYPDETLRAYGEAILDWQTPEGYFPYEPDGRHLTEHNTMARNYRPIGQPGDVEILDFYMTSSILLLTLGDALDEPRFIEAGRKALEVAMPLERPEGGDWWEIPVHAPNYYTAGWGAIAYYLGYEMFGDPKYKKRSIHFLRAQLPFTYIWESPVFPLSYHTKPTFGGTGWRYMAWHNRCVHWEGVSIIHMSRQLKFDWNLVDPEMDWDQYQAGILTAGLRLLADSKDPDWVKLSEDVDEKFKAGKMDMFIADTFDPVAKLYGGLIVRIAPDPLVMCSLDRLWENQ